MSSQFLRREFLSATIEIAKKKLKKYKGAVEAGGFATKQMGLGKSEKKVIADRGKRVNINQNTIPSI